MGEDRRGREKKGGKQRKIYGTIKTKKAKKNELKKFINSCVLFHREIA